MTILFIHILVHQLGACDRQENHNSSLVPFQCSELPMNKRQMLAHVHADVHVSNPTLFRDDCFLVGFMWGADDDWSSRGQVLFTFHKQQVLLSLAPAIIQPPFSQARYLGDTSIHIFHPICSLVWECFSGVLPTQWGDFEIANIITQPGSNLVGCGADETLAETLIVWFIMYEEEHS